MLMGTYEHRLDTKARLVLPTKIREKLGNVVIVTVGLDKCVSLYSVAEWKTFADGNISNLKFISNPKHRAFVRAMLGSAHEMPIDGTGRVLVPSPLREYAELSQEVVVIGANDHAEVWDKKRWEADHKPNLDKLSELAQDLASGDKSDG